MRSIKAPPAPAPMPAFYCEADGQFYWGKRPEPTGCSWGVLLFIAVMLIFAYLPLWFFPLMKYLTTPSDVTASSYSTTNDAYGCVVGPYAGSIYGPCN